MLGWPAAQSQARMLHVSLCNGGTADIPIGPEHAPHRKDCPAGCHAPVCQTRKRLGSPSV